MKLRLLRPGNLAAVGVALLALPAASVSQNRVTVPVRATSQTESGGGCVEGLRDAGNPSSPCILASTTPQLGRLLPLSQDLFVHPTSRFVGMGTTFPVRPLEVVGQIAMTTPGSIIKATMRPSASQVFGIVETTSLPPGAPFPQVTNLIATSAIDPAAGALGTVREGSFLTALTTPANDPGSGFVSVFNASVEVAGINGGTGIVFGAAKSFVQPHPSDATKEIQYVSLEGPEHGVYARGTAQLAGGEAVIALPESFRLVAREEGLTVTVTPLGPTRGLYVASKGLAGVVVRENPGGTGDASFDYVVMGERAALPQHVAIRDNVHFAPEPGTAIPAGSLPGSYRDLMIENGTLDPDGSVNTTSATRLGWRHEQGTWTGGRRASAPIADR